MTFMRLKNVRKADLNLLKVLYALGAERQVTRAGETIGLSQPGMSHALRRLRGQFGDPLFLRTLDGMVPTARGAILADAVRRALDDLDNAFDRLADFDPATAESTFRIGMNDYASLLILPKLMAQIRRAAPGITIRSVNVGSGRPGQGISAPSVYERLDDGDIDLAVVRRHDRQGRFDAEALFMEDPVCVAARDNEAFPEGALDLPTYLTFRHVRITILDKDRGWIDDLLRARGLERRVALTVPHYSVAAAVAAATDLVATLPLSVVETYGRIHALKTAPLPFAPKPYGAILVWPKTRSDDPAHAWLRQAVRACFAEVPADGA